MLSNHKNQLIFSQMKLLFELIAALLTKKELKYHKKLAFFD
jgi:hypothetical protein